MISPTIQFPTAEENADRLKRFFDEQRTIRRERVAAEEQARIALPLLVEACHGKTGQSYKIRALLYSLWNGSKPASLVEVVSLDWALHKAICSVILAFGTDSFFHDEIKSAFQEVGLFDWFIEEGEL